MLAHPGGLADYRTLLTRLLPLGLDGVEVYPDHGRALIRELRAFAFQLQAADHWRLGLHRRDATGGVRIGALGFPRTSILSLLSRRAPPTTADWAFHAPLAKDSL